MQIQSKPMGMFETNCYIATLNGKDFIIDPGVDATEWVIQHVKNPVAVLNTHGHFDHIWCNAELKKKLNIPLIIHEKDAFMLKASSFIQDLPVSEADILVNDASAFEIENESITFHHFPGHTPGCSIIELGGVIFSGDFIFNGSIGRYDFPYSDAQEMKTSLMRFMEIEENYELYPGHGPKTTVKQEQHNIPMWLNSF